MALITDRQLRILRVINEGHTTGEAIVDALGSSMQMLSHYMNQMVEDGYIKAAKVYDNELRDFIVVRAYLTPEGQSILAGQPPIVNPGVAAGASASKSTSNAKTPIAAESIDYAAVAASLDRLEKIITELPQDWRELAEVYLDDLRNEINVAYRRHPVRIRAYFLAILRTLLPVIGKIAKGEDFVQQAKLLSRQLGIPVKLPGY
jgi:DeoR family transcriptional regulator, catabolite repression regulator